MKSLRRSLNKDTPIISTPAQLPSLGKPVPATAPPQKVVRALQPYRSTGPQELSFGKGDFFYVVKDLKDWYEVTNPLTGSRGLVPRSYFEELKNSTSQGSRLSAPGAHNGISISGPISPPLPQVHTGPTPTARAPPAKLPRLQTFYAIVQYDFKAERPDELDARAGEPLTVVAQSNREWFVAKPIGRLGGAGLIPAAFVEIRDPTTGKPIADVDGLIERGELPRVEEWKRRTSEYKASSIPLGVLDDPVPPVPTQFARGSSQGHMSGAGLSEQSTPPALDPSSGASSMEDSRHSQELPLLPYGQLITASVPSFHFESEEYWFRINARYAPYPPHDRAPAPPIRELVLYRVYDDFYEFQIALLDALPVEAGRQTPGGTPIPTPGPDEPPPDRMLPYMPGPLNYVDDSITTIRCKELDEYLGNLCDLNSRGATHVLAHPLVRRFFSPRVGDTMDEVAVEAAPGPAYSDGQTVGDQTETVANQFSRMGVHDRTSGYQASTHTRTHSRTHSRAQSQSQSRSQSQAGRYSEYEAAGQLMSPPLPTASSGGTSGGVHTPNPAFIKVKIFHRSTDDLIAIRVPPNVTHKQLMTKVRERLDRDVAKLQYRDSMRGRGEEGFIELIGDEALREWIRASDKLVLFAD
ncbi:SH3 domain-containing protein [Ceratobasidium sp. AG-Ba]|nr:SH3 domain-containing protein [Ceratobasidium sp. AG-Ba]